MMKILYFDVETTGLDSEENDVFQLAGAIEINGRIQEEFNFDIRPFNLANVSPEALQVTQKTFSELESYPNSVLIHDEFVRLLSKYVDKFDKADKFYPAGYNVQFDIDFLRSFFFKCGDRYYGSWFNYRWLDPYPVLHILESLGYLKLDNYKLETVCDYLGIDIDAHDAMSDIRATINVFNYVRKKII